MEHLEVLTAYMGPKVMVGERSTPLPLNSHRSENGEFPRQLTSNYSCLKGLRLKFSCPPLFSMIMLPI